MFLKRLINNKLGVIVATTLILVSCQGGTNSGSNTAASADSLNEKQISNEVKDVVYPLPTPFEMTSMLNGIGAKYIFASLNPVDKAEKYFTEKSKAVCVGVYGADLAYAATYDQKQDVNVYSKVLKKLVDQLGVNIDYSYMLSDDFKKKINNKDTLTKIITNTFYDTYKNLNSKSNPDLAVMMVSGMWVELMYIATNISDDTYHYSGLVKIISDQKESYGKLMKLLNEHNSSAEIKDLEDKLATLKPSFDKVDKGLSEQDYKVILNNIKSVRKGLVE